MQLLPSGRALTAGAVAVVTLMAGGSAAGAASAPVHPATPPALPLPPPRPTYR